MSEKQGSIKIWWKHQRPAAEWMFILRYPLHVRPVQKKGLGSSFAPTKWPYQRNLGTVWTPVDHQGHSACFLGFSTYHGLSSNAPHRAPRFHARPTWEEPSNRCISVPFFAVKSPSRSGRDVGGRLASDKVPGTPPSVAHKGANSGSSEEGHQQRWLQYATRSDQAWGDLMYFSRF